MSSATSYVSGQRNTATDRNNRIETVVNAAGDQPASERRKHFAATLKAALAGGEEAAQAEHDEFMANLQSRHNPHTMKKISLVIDTYLTTVEVRSPHILPQDHWRTDVVKTHAPLALRHYARATPGTKGRPHPKALTFTNFANRLISQIGFLAVDEHGNKAGIPLLCTEGLYDILQDEVYTLINQLELDRHQEEKVLYGDLELLLMIQTALKDSVSGSTRLSKIQDIVILLLFFYTGLRPSSLAYNHKKYLDEGKYPKLGNLVFERLGFLDFRMKLKITDFKGMFGAVGQCVTFCIASPQLWSNVFLDLPLHMLIFLMERGALEGVSTIEELASGQESEIRIKADMANAPLLCKMTSGGRGLIEEPISARALSAIVTHLAENAGLKVGGGGYVFRRNAAEVMATLVNEAAAEMLLVHKRPGSLHNYQVQVTNMDLTTMMLYEDPTLVSPLAQRARNLRRMDSPAISAILCAIHSEKPRQLLHEQGALEPEIEEADLMTPEEAVEEATSATSKKKSHTVEIPPEIQEQIKADPTLIKLQKDSEEAFQLTKDYWEGYTGKGQIKDLTSFNTYKKHSTLKNEDDAEAAQEAEAFARLLSRQVNSRKSKLAQAARRKIKKDGVSERTKLGVSAMEFPGTVRERHGVRDNMNHGGANFVRSVISHPSSAPAGGETSAAGAASGAASAAAAVASPDPASSASAAAAPSASSSDARSSAASSAGTSSAPSASSDAAASSSSATSSAATDDDPSASAAVEARIAEAASHAEEEDETDEEDDCADIHVGMNIINCELSKARKAKGQDSAGEGTIPTSGNLILDHGLQFSETPEPDGSRAVEVPTSDISSAPTAPTEDESKSLREAREAYLRYVIAPLETLRLLKKCKTTGGWKCLKCAKYVHNTKKAETLITSEVNLKRHLQFQHSEWADLEVTAAQQDENGDVRYDCQRCDASFEKMDDLREHYLDSCPDKDFFAGLHLDHQSIVRTDKQTSKPEASKTIVRQCNQFLKGEEALLAAVEDMDEDVRERVGGILAALKRVKGAPPTEEQIAEYIAKLKYDRDKE